MTANGTDSRRDEGLREEAAAWLARLRGPSTPEDHAAFEAWYDAAPEHAEAYDGVLRTWEAVGLAKHAPAGQARSRPRSGGIHRCRYAIAAVAAAIVIALLAFGAYGTRLGTPASVRSGEFASGTGEVRTLELVDGSRITLNSASAVRAAYSASERRVELLRGRARFAVAHNEARPFVVATPVGLVIAHGTVFDVAFDGRRASVSLIEGSVEVRPMAVAGKSAGPRLLTPGQQVIVQPGEIQAATRAIGNENDRSNGMVSFEDASLDQVIAVVNRSGGARIVLADPALAKLRFTGTFDPADGEQLARLVAASFGLQLSRGEGGTLVLAQPRSRPASDEKIPG